MHTDKTELIGRYAGARLCIQTTQADTSPKNIHSVKFSGGRDQQCLRNVN